MIVLFDRLAITTHFSSSNATLHTASAGAVSSLTNCPVFRSQTLTLPSLPPLTTRVSSNCKLVTLLSCAASRCIGAIFSNDQTRTEPSEPPVTKVLPRICNWPTSEVCPCRIAWQDLKSVNRGFPNSEKLKPYPLFGSHIRTLVSKLPVAILAPSNAIA